MRHRAEAFSPELRYSGSSLGYQHASVVAGGPAPTIAAWLLHTFDSGYAIAGYIMVSAAVSMAATLLLRERPAELAAFPAATSAPSPVLERAS
jgi:hypothetical protein